MDGEQNAYTSLLVASWVKAEIKSPEGFSSGLIYMRETKEFLRSRICEGLHAQVNWFLLL